MAENKMIRDPIPENFKTLEEFDEFWSTHDITDYDDLLHEVTFNIVLDDDESVSLEPTIARQLRQRARNQGVSLASLVNALLSEKLQEPV